MTKHTPGPWSVHRDIGTPVGTLKIAPPMWPALNVPTVAAAYGKEGEQQANACLIAAAPDMLAELKQALACLKQYREYGEAMRSHGRGFQATDKVGRTIDSVIAGAEAAIAKATGE